MRLLQNIIKRIWDKVLVICGVLCVLLPTSPLNMPSVYWSSGVFLYTGWRILNGQLPYRDIWDHKPPIIFYINALGLAIGNNSRWGVWLIEFFSLFLAAFIGFRLIKKALGSFPAIFSLLLWLLTLVFLIEGGNLTEEYSLPLQFAALWLVYDADKSDVPYWRYFLIGLIGAIAFFTKQTSIGVWIAIIIYLTFRRLTSGQVKRWLNELFLISVGSLVLVIPIIIFFSVQGTFPQFWSAAFKYNFYYSTSITGIGNRLHPVIGGMKPLTEAGLFQFSMIGYILAVILILSKKSIIINQITLLLIGLIDLPIELILISTSGKTYVHYYMAILPVLSLFAGLTFWAFLSLLSSWGTTKILKYIFIISTVGIFLWSSLSDYKSQVVAYRSVGEPTVINYVRSTTSPNDYVLLWGSESYVNYYTQRRSPTRFVYQYPLYTQGYVNEQMIIEFLDDVIRNCPRLIIDTKNPMTPMYDFPIHTEAINARIAYLQSHYHVLENVGPWTVYRYIENP